MFTRLDNLDGVKHNCEVVSRIGLLWLIFEMVFGRSRFVGEATLGMSHVQCFCVTLVTTHTRSKIGAHPKKYAVLVLE